jgi:hypothetical protein
MKITKHRISAKPKRKGDVPPRLFRLFFLWGGIFALIVFAVLIAVRWDHGMADFLFWLTAIWISLVRYVESSCSGGEFLRPSRPALRKWRRFCVILVMAAVFLYALARIAAS